MPPLQPGGRPPLRVGVLAQLPIGSVRAAGRLGDTMRSHSQALGGTLDDALARGGPVNPRVVESLMYLGRTTADAALIPIVKRGFERLIEESGGSPVAPGAYVVSRALLAYYRSFGDARALKHIVTRCADQIAALADSRAAPAETLAAWSEFAETAMEAYNITGHAQLLKLAQKWVKVGFDWAGWFHRFPQIQPVRRDMPYEQMSRLVNEELAAGGAANIHTLESLATRGDMLAIGLRSCLIKSVITGSLRDEQAFKAGLEKLARYHGVACGMYTSDAHVQGRDPSRAIWSPAAVEMVRSMTAAMRLAARIEDAGECADAAERIAYNLIPSYIIDGGRYIRDAQRVNEIESVPFPKAHYSLPDDACVFASTPLDGPNASQLLGTLPLFASMQWMRSADGGLAMMGFMPCEVRHRTDSGLVRLNVESNYPYGGEAVIRVSCKGTTELPIAIRVPSWAEGAHCVLPDGETIELPPCNYININKPLWNGAEIRVNFEMRPQIVEVSPGNVSVERGPVVYALPISADERVDEADGLRRFTALTPWKEAIVLGAELSVMAPESAGAAAAIEAETVRVPEWNVKRRTAAAPPRDFTSDQETSSRRLLIPFAQTVLRVAQFPVCSNSLKNIENTESM